MLVASVGIAAVVLTAAMLPSQASHVIRNRNSPKLLAGVSLTSAAIVCTTSILWACYGIRYGAVWAAATAIIDFLFQLLIVAVVLRHRRPRGTDTARVVAVTLCVLVLGLTASQSVLGGIGAFTSLMMFMPQAVRVVRARGTTQGGAFSPVAATFLIVANSVWLAYGILLKDIWLILPCPFSITSGFLILWAWSGSRSLAPTAGERNRTIPETPDDIPASVV